MPAGRIILKSISSSKKLSEIKTDGARLLYTWLIPHLDVNGCFSGDPEVIKGIIFTRLEKPTKLIEEYLQDLEINNLIIRYENNGDVFLCVPDFLEKQPHINKEREAKPTILLPTPDLLQTYSRPTPDELLHKVKEKVKFKEKEKEFEMFWNTYPNKKDKARAKKTYFVCVGKGIIPERILKHTERYMEECKRAETELKFIKHPATFLNATDFTEEPPEIKKESWRDLPQFRGLL